MSPTRKWFISDCTDALIAAESNVAGPLTPQKYRAVTANEPSVAYIKDTFGGWDEAMQGAGLTIPGRYSGSDTTGEDSAP